MATQNNKINVDQVQIALFPNNFVITNPSTIGAKLLEENFISGNNLIINSFLTSDAPGELVRIESVLQDNQDIRLQIAQTKVSLYFNNPSNNPDFKVNLEDIQKRISEIYKLFLEGLSFNRVGFITTIYRVTQDPISLFKRNFKFENKDDLYDVETKLTFDTKFDDKEWEAIQFNKYITLASGYVINDPSKKAMILQYDLNIKQDQNPNWQIENVMRFLKQSYERSLDPEEMFLEIFKK